MLNVVDYLEACNKLFERGLLDHVRINTYPNQILDNMEEGYSFFTKWLDSLLTSGKFRTICVLYGIYKQTHASFSFVDYNVADPWGKKIHFLADLGPAENHVVWL